MHYEKELNGVKVTVSRRDIRCWVTRVYIKDMHKITAYADWRFDAIMLADRLLLAPTQDLIAKDGLLSSWQDHNKLTIHGIKDGFKLPPFRFKKKIKESKKKR